MKNPGEKDGRSASPSGRLALGGIVAALLITMAFALKVDDESLIETADKPLTSENSVQPEYSEQLENIVDNEEPPETAMPSEYVGISQVQRALDAFAISEGVARDAIQITSVEAVTWNDSSLGCGKPGEMALQVLTPGYRIVLNHGDRSATFHSDEGNVVIRCTKPSFNPVAPMPGTGADFSDQ